MKKLAISGLVLGLLFVLAAPAPAQVDFGIGAGVLYNKMLGSIDASGWKIDKDYFSYLLSLKMQFLGFLGLEGVLNYYPGKDDIDYTVTPMGTATLNLLGDLINVGVGINSSYVKYDSPAAGSGDKWSDLTYHFKAGVQIPLGGLLWINGDVYYFVDQFKNIEDFDKDYLTFGARIHLRF